MTTHRNGNQSLAALLIDLENLYFSLANDFSNPADLTMTILQAVREYLYEKLSLSPVVGKAYAPFDYSTTRILMNDLALMGISPVHVLAYAQKNSADLMLAIDAMEILFNRTDVETFVIVGGDRDYIPVVERIRQNAKNILVVSPRSALSGDLLTIVGQENYLDPLTLLPEGRARKKEEQEQIPRMPSQPPAVVPASASAAVSPSGAPPLARTTQSAKRDFDPGQGRAPHPSSMAELIEIVDDTHEMEDLISCMTLILSFQKELHVREIWLSPFLRSMNDAFPLKANSERKQLLGRLEEFGAIRIEERPRNDDVGGTFAVLMVNWSHPLVVDVNPG